jgi:hypothetical protein
MVMPGGSARTDRIEPIYWTIATALSSAFGQPTYLLAEMEVHAAQ